MNLSQSEGGSGVPALITKLCNHFAKNDTQVAANLLKIAFNFLTASSFTRLTTPNDEQYIVAEIRKSLLTTQSSESVEKFDLLYSILQKSTILNNKCSILTFLMYLGKEPTQKEINKWSMLQELQQAQGRVNAVKSQLNIENSQETLKKIYSGALNKNCNSNHTQVIKMGKLSSQTIGTSVLWSQSDSDLARISESCSRTTIPTNVTEDELIQDVIYSFQGIEGRFLKKEPAGLGFVLDPKLGRGIGPVHRGLLERLSGVGFLHNQLKMHCDENDKQSGIIGQALTAILRDELSDYYRTVAILQAQLKKQNCLEHTELTLRRMVVWVSEHHMRFQWLAYIAEECSDKKGGALVSAVHGFLQHGSKCAQMISERVLTAVCRPLYLMLSRWLLDGELNDPCGEFFIEARSINSAERLWHDKYYVKTSMMPSFITTDQAKKILATGKSINFLRQICKDADHLPGREALQKLFTTTTAQALFNPEQCVEFHSILESVYKETSHRVLDLLKGKYRLMEHLHALRRYLLLGQGDFIRHLLELLAPELCKPVQELYGHTLTAILESAVRVTTAQYEDEDTLQRLNVGLLNQSQGDIGWDVFSLIYIVDGPVGTIFQPTMTTYKCLFGALWQAKRMEFVLSNMRKQQISSAKLFKKIKELKPVVHLIHLLTNKMIHFLHQTQYYFLFEVLECSWAEMLKQVNQAECLDDIITAHTIFLNSVKCGVLLDPSSAELRSQLRIIYNLILSLESVQDTLYAAALKEHNNYTEHYTKARIADGFGFTQKEETEFQEKTVKFHKCLSSVKRQLKQLTAQYSEFIQKYLNLLATNSNLNLQLLSVRLNFNDNYKIT